MRDPPSGPAPAHAAAAAADVNAAIFAGVQLGGRLWANSAPTAGAAPAAVPAPDSDNVRVCVIDLAGVGASTAAAAGPSASDAGVAALFVQDMRTQRIELHAPSSATPAVKPHASTTGQRATARPKHLHVGPRIDGAATLQALRAEFGLACEPGPAVPLLRQQPADADVEHIVRSKLRDAIGLHPGSSWQDALAVVAEAMNCEVAPNNPEAAARSTVPAAAKRPREVIVIDSDSEDDMAGREGAAGPAPGTGVGEPGNRTTAAAKKRRRLIHNAGRATEGKA